MIGKQEISTDLTVFGIRRLSVVRLEGYGRVLKRRSEVRSASVHNIQRELGDAGPEFYHHRLQLLEDA